MKRITPLILIFTMVTATAFGATQGIMPQWCFYDSVGDPLSGGKVFTFSTGTSTPKTTFTDAGEGTPNANPVILNSNGCADIWLDGQYRVRVDDTDDVNVIPSTDDVDSLDTIITITSSAEFVLEHETDGKHESRPLLSSYNSCDIADAVTTIGATELILLVDCEDNIADGVTVTIPSTLGLEWTPAGLIDETVGGGAETLTINGTIFANREQKLFGINLVVNGSPKLKTSYPKWFGAVGDGVADDSKAIATMLGLNVLDNFLTDGTYLTDPLTMSADHQVLRGTGELKLSASQTSPLLTLSGFRVGISGIRIDGNKANQTSNDADAIFITGDKVWVDNTFIKDTAGHCIESADASELSITDNTLIDCGLTTNNGGAGITVSSGENNRIHNNFVSNPSRLGIRIDSETTHVSRNFTVTDNTVVNFNNAGATNEPIAISAGINSGENSIIGLVMTGNIAFSPDNTTGGNAFDLNGVFDAVFANNIGIGGTNGINPDFSTNGGGRIIIKDNIFKFNQRCILYVGDATNIEWVNISDNLCYDNEGGINVTNATNSIIKNNQVIVDSDATITTISGIFITDGVSNSNISDNQVVDTRGAGATVVNAVLVNEAGAENNIIIGNTIDSQAYDDDPDANFAGTVSYFKAGGGLGAKDNTSEHIATDTTIDAAGKVMLKIQSSIGYAARLTYEVIASSALEHAVYTGVALYNNTGTLSLVSDNRLTEIETTAGMSVTLTAVDPGIIFTVEGVAATSIDWKITAVYQGLIH